MGAGQEEAGAGKGGAGEGRAPRHVQGFSWSQDAVCQQARVALWCPGSSGQAVQVTARCPAPGTLFHLHGCTVLFFIPVLLG